ncbi:Uncharacterised protein [Candidatus Anstonella stagnisolia]|nr:Uncharacterised protein [Candidatus Anstonella stagnisolia]
MTNGSGPALMQQQPVVQDAFQQKLDSQINLLFTRDSTYKGGYKITGGAGSPFATRENEYVAMSKRAAEKYIGAHADEFGDVKKAAVYFVTAVLGSGNGKKFAERIGSVEDGEVYAKFEQFMKDIGVGKTGRGWTGGNFAEFIKNVTGAEYDAASSTFKAPVAGAKDTEGTQLDVSPARISAEANAMMLGVLNEHPIMKSLNANVESLSTEDINKLLVVCDNIGASPLSGEICGAVADSMGKENIDVATALKKVDMDKYQPGKTADEKIAFLDKVSKQVSGIISEGAEKTVVETAKAILDDAQFKGEKRAEFVHNWAQREKIIVEGTDGQVLSADREEAAKGIIKAKAEAAGISVDEEGLNTAFENFKKNLSAGDLGKKVYETSFLKKDKVSGQEVLEELLKGELAAKAGAEAPQAPDYSAAYSQIEAGVKATYEFLASKGFSEEDVANIPPNVIVHLATGPTATEMGAAYDERTETGKIDKLRGAYESLFGAGSWEGEGAQPAVTADAQAGKAASLQTGALDEADGEEQNETKQLQPGTGAGARAVTGGEIKLENVTNSQELKNWLMGSGMIDEEAIGKIDESNYMGIVESLKVIPEEDRNDADVLRGFVRESVGLKED